MVTLVTTLVNVERMNNQNLLSLQEPKGDNQNGTNFSFGRSWGWRSGAMAGDTREKEELIETRDAVIKEMRSRGKTIDLQKFKVSVSWDMLLGRWS